VNLAEALESVNVEQITFDDGEVPTRAFVIVVRENAEWVAPKPMFASSKGMGFEEIIGLLTSVLDYMRDENVRAWRSED
jgi:hypothetical protein